jgi:hypothetical protein
MLFFEMLYQKKEKNTYYFDCFLKKHFFLIIILTKNRILIFGYKMDKLFVIN